METTKNEIEIKTDEKYRINILGQHVLTLETKAKLDGEWITVDTIEVKLPREIPKYWTKLDLWHHTDSQLKELERRRSIKGEKTPSDTTLKDWRLWIEQSKSQTLLQD